MLSEEVTRFSELLPAAAPVGEARHHCLVETGRSGTRRRHLIPATGLSVGRVPPADLILADTNVSRLHCRFAIAGSRLLLTDLGSTNGSFVDQRRVAGTKAVPVGSTVRVGGHIFLYELITDEQLRRAAESDRDMDAAVGYIRALLPAPRETGPLAIDWHFEPSAKIGGDAFGCEPLPDGRWMIFLIDVSGHGAAAALHAVTITTFIRQRAFACDPGAADAVLAELDRRFPMEAHGEMFFTAWYGLYDPATRRLAYASGGHHPAMLLAGGARQGLATRNRLLGFGGTKPFAAAEIAVPAAASLYLFSDGVFEFDDRTGRRWALGDFTALLGEGPVSGVPGAIYEAVRAQVPGHAFDDDFSLLGVTFA